MHGLEQRLQRARLAQPSADFDRRISAEFAHARRRLARPEPPLFWRWFTALATVGTVALVFFATRDVAPRSSAAVYEVEAQGLLRDLLASDSPAQSELPAFSFRTNATPGALHESPQHE